METNHEIDWENRKFLDSESHWRRRKIKEALFVDCLNPQKEVTDSTITLHYITTFQPDVGNREHIQQ